MATPSPRAIVRISLLTLKIVALLCLLPSAPAAGVASAPSTRIVVTVSTSFDEYNLSSNSTCSLREAIATVNGNADFGGCTQAVVPGSGPPLIVLPSDTYTLTLSGANEDQNATGDLDVRRSVIISTTGSVPATVTGSPNWDDRIIHILTGTVTISGSTISGGHPAIFGGGGLLIASGTSVTLEDSAVAGNSAHAGGGGIESLGILTLTNVSLSGNTSVSDGGGLMSGGSGAHAQAVLTNVTLSGNSAGSNGGGILNSGAVLTLTNVSLSGNSAHFGGGIQNFGRATLTNVTLDGNWASSFGGGISNVISSVAVLTNVTLSANSIKNCTVNCFGGGIYNDNSSSILLTNVTLSANTIDNCTSNCYGGGIYNNIGTATLNNTIVANSPSGGNCNEFLLGYKSISSDGTCGFGAGRDSVNVLLAPLANNGGSTLTHMLLPGSPAIDFGTNFGCPSTDQRGLPRPVGTACDVGAVERQPGDPGVRLSLPLIVR